MDAAQCLDAEKLLAGAAESAGLQPEDVNHHSADCIKYLTRQANDVILAALKGSGSCYSPECADALRRQEFEDMMQNERLSLAGFLRPDGSHWPMQAPVVEMHRQTLRVLPRAEEWIDEFLRINIPEHLVAESAAGESDLHRSQQEREAKKLRDQLIDCSANAALDIVEKKIPSVLAKIDQALQKQRSDAARETSLWSRVRRLGRKLPAPAIDLRSCYSYVLGLKALVSDIHRAWQESCTLYGVELPWMYETNRLTEADIHRSYYEKIVRSLANVEADLEQCI